MGWSLSEIQLPVGVPKAVKSVLGGVTLGMAHTAEGHDSTVVEGDHNIERQVCVTAGQVQVKM